MAEWKENWTENVFAGPPEGIHKVAEKTWKVHEKVTDAARLAHHLGDIFALGGSFLIHEGRYLSAIDVRKAKDAFELYMRRAAEDPKGAHTQAYASRAGWHLSAYVSECRVGDRPEFGLLPIDERVLRSKELRAALVRGFTLEVRSNYDEDEERFPGSERSQRLHAQREELCAAFGEFVTQKAAELPRIETALQRFVRLARHQAPTNNRPL
jgi:hypothetical protein